MFLCFWLLAFWRRVQAQAENRQALDVHKAHLACLVARCSLVSRWAGDRAVRAAMVSCLPAELLPKVGELDVALQLRCVYCYHTYFLLRVLVLIGGFYIIVLF